MLNAVSWFLQGENTAALAISGATIGWRNSTGKSRAQPRISAGVLIISFQVECGACIVTRVIWTCISFAVYMDGIFSAIRRMTKLYVFKEVFLTLNTNPNSKYES